MMRIAGHIFSGRPCTVPCGNELGIGTVLPDSMDLKTISDVQNATEIEVLNERTGKLSSAYHITSWYSMEFVESRGIKGIAFYWKVSWYDETSLMQYSISQLRMENEELRKTNADLEAGLLELASIVGSIETSE